MCLAIPMQITAIDVLFGRCEVRTAVQHVTAFEHRDELPQVGDHVMVSAGQAVRKVSEEDARLSWELYDQILAETPEPPANRP